jgi:hypothetical protein
MKSLWKVFSKISFQKSVWKVYEKSCLKLLFKSKAQNASRKGISKSELKNAHAKDFAKVKGPKRFGSKVKGLKYPEYDSHVLELIPHTNGQPCLCMLTSTCWYIIAGGWAHGRRSSSKFFWESDIYDMSQRVGVLQKDVALRKKGAKKALEQFKINRKIFIDDVQVVRAGHQIYGILRFKVSYQACTKMR